MCTAIHHQTKDHYFGRNLDYEHSFDTCVTVTPRNYPIPLQSGNILTDHYAMIGMASVVDGYPLYFDATNEAGLSVAGLNFPENAVYKPPATGKCNIAPYELPLWLLGKYANLKEAEGALSNINLTNINFSNELPLTPLHWLVADKSGAIVVEPTENGVKLYKDTVGVLTNNPPFEYHQHNLNNYLNLTSRTPENRFSSQLKLRPYSRGMGAIGIPGDLSSSSRFVRCAFTKLNSVSGNSEIESVTQFFHILGSVAQQRGCAAVNDSYEITQYTSCCNTDKGIYYYTTYENSRITAIRMLPSTLNTTGLITYPLQSKQVIYYEN